MKLAKAKPILFEHPVIINYLAGGLFKNLYEKYAKKPGLLVKALSDVPDFVTHIENAISYLLVKSLSKLSLDSEPSEETKYYINFYLLKKNRITAELEKGLIDWVEVPPNFSIEEFLDNLKFVRTKENQFFLLDSVIRKRIIRNELNVKYSYEIFVMKETLKSSRIVDEEI